MIADLDETLQNLLMAELPITDGEIDVSFAQPRREWSARLSRPTVNLFLYDVRENATLRQHAWERVQNGQTNGQSVGIKRTPLRVDCFYMLTTWAAEPDDEHRLLTRCMLALFRYPILPSERLVGSLKRQPYEIQARLASPDKLTNPAEVWSALDNEIRPTISYILTLSLDPWTAFSGPVVRTRVMRLGQTTSPRQFAPLEPGADSQVIIGGTVWLHTEGETPVADIDVAVKGTGLFAKTDAQGRFVLGSLPPAAYTLVAWPAEGKPCEKHVVLPAIEGNYDLVLKRKSK